MTNGKSKTGVVTRSGPPKGRNDPIADCLDLLANGLDALGQELKSGARVTTSHTSAVKRLQKQASAIRSMYMELRAPPFQTLPPPVPTEDD